MHVCYFATATCDFRGQSGIKMTATDFVGKLRIRNYSERLIGWIHPRESGAVHYKPVPAVPSPLGAG